MDLEIFADCVFNHLLIFGILDNIEHISMQMWPERGERLTNRLFGMQAIVYHRWKFEPSRNADDELVSVGKLTELMQFKILLSEGPPIFHKLHVAFRVRKV